MNSINLLPELFLKKEDCCGCTACYSICPVNAINMLADDEGFFYPEIDTKKCIGCKKCINVCAFKATKKDKQIPDTEFPKIFAFKHNNYYVRTHSQSGGAFTAFSDEIIKNGGAVYGCVMTDNHMAIHKKAETFEERDEMRGSKYIQSDMGEIFSNVKHDLSLGKQVMFTGTPCQIDALKLFLKTDYDNLLCIDIVCHGVPSPLIWTSYLSWLEKEYNAKSIPIKSKFRNKDFGWDSHIETLKLKKENGKETEINSEIFKELFYKEYILRPSCYQCPYTSLHRPGNITIADFWMINNILPGINDNKGLSMVLVNDEKGETLFNTCKKEFFFQEVKLGGNLQRPLREPAKKPNNRKEFWTDWNQKGFSYIVEKYVTNKSTDIKINKFRQYYFLLNQWIQLKQKGLSFEKYFIELGYENIAIYGMGEVGMRLLDELKATNINVKYVIDKADISVEKIPVIKNITSELNVDAIVVTPMFAFDDIKEEFEAITTAQIISIEEIIFGSI